MSDNINGTEVKSFQDKIGEATHLAFEIIYADKRPSGGYLNTKDDERITDEVWEWADGLPQAWIEDRVDGRCSPKSLVDFDMEAQEKSVDDIIKTFESILEQVGRPKTLTQEEYIAMGYKA